MKSPSAVRALALECIRSDFVLKCDRGDALFITDCLTADDRLRAAGFVSVREKAMTRIYPGLALVETARTWMKPDKSDYFFKQLAQLDGCFVRAEELTLLTKALKAGEPGGSTVPDFEKKLRQAAAVCLRLGGGGALSVCYALHLQTKEDFL